jgi:hypothetical protein
MPEIFSSLSPKAGSSKCADGVGDKEDGLEQPLGWDRIDGCISPSSGVNSSPQIRMLRLIAVKKRWR